MSKFRFRKRKNIGAGKTTRSIATKALKAAKNARSLIDASKYFIDVTGSGVTMSNNGTITLLTPIAQGDDVNNRSGNSVLAKSFRFSYDITQNTAAGQTSQMARVLIVSDKLQTGTAPTPAQILQTLGNANAVNSPINVDALPRFSVLYDRRHSLESNGDIRQHGMCRKHFSKRISYTGAATTDTYKNNIYLLVLSDVAANDPLMNYSSRVGYLDN